MSEPVVAQKSPFKQELEAGQSYFWCACGYSDKQPYCNGAHKEHGMAPMKVDSDKDQTVFFCGCKQTKTPPYCDGTHSSL